MAIEDEAGPDRTGWPIRNPRPLLLASLGAAALLVGVFALPLWVYRVTGLDLGGFALTGGFWAFVRVLLVAAAGLLAGGAVAVRPKDVLVLLGAALASVLIAFGMEPAWDSARLVMFVFTGVALFAAFLVSLPAIGEGLFTGYYFLFPGDRHLSEQDIADRGRFAGSAACRTVVALLAMLHFVGILSAVMSVPVGNREQSYVAMRIHDLWAPYLDFAFLNNAYRFYSPEPGPPTLLWFHIEYADGSTRWLKLPTRSDHAPDPAAQEFTRRLSIAESVNQINRGGFIPDELKRARLDKGLKTGIHKHPEYPIEMQYQPPFPMAQQLIGEYARYVARNNPNPDNPAAAVTGIKVYRVVHNLLEPKQMASDKLKPNDPWTYLPYYQGEFTPEGELKDPADPLLYWLIPIFPWPKGEQPNPIATTGPLNVELIDFDVIDCLEVHRKLPTATAKKEGQ